MGNSCLNQTTPLGPLPLLCSSPALKVEEEERGNESVSQAIPTPIPRLACTGDRTLSPIFLPLLLFPSDVMLSPSPPPISLPSSVEKELDAKEKEAEEEIWSRGK